MRVYDLFRGALAVRIGLWIGRRMPRAVGYGVSRLIANLVVRGKPDVYWIVRDNLCHVVGHDVDDGVVEQVFCHAGQAYYDFFRAIPQPPSVHVRLVTIAPASIEVIRSEMAAGRGVLLLGLHTSNFDLALLTLSAHGSPAQVLSAAAPNAGFALLDDLRRAEHCEVTPITPQSLRAAIARLDKGGLVITGADRPVPGEPASVAFFGCPAYLPIGSARLALLTGATVLVGACYQDRARGYVLDISGPYEMVRTGHRRQDVLASTRRLALVMEAIIRAHPTQWLMFHRVWPEQRDMGDNT